MAELHEICTALQVSPQLGRVVELLLTRPVVPTNEIEDKLGAPGSAKVAVHRLRKRLHKEGVVVNSVYGVGYFLPPQARGRVLRKIESLCEL